MAGYDLEKPGRPGDVLSKKRLEEIVRVLEKVAAGDTILKMQARGEVDAPRFYRTLVEYPDVAKAYGVARELSGYSFEEMALDEASKLVAPNEYTGTKIKAVEVAMGQWRWSAARRNQKEFSGQQGVSLVVPIQINTSLDIGQGGVIKAQLQDNTYEFAAQVARETVVEAEAEEYTETVEEEPVEGSAKFGLIDPPKRGIKKNVGGRPPGKGHWKNKQQTAVTKVAYARRNKPNGTA